MLETVGIDPEGYSNKSARATLITRMSAMGVPTEVGMKVSGHHTATSYAKYDRTEELKMRATEQVICASKGASYDETLGTLSESYVQGKILGISTYDNKTQIPG